MAYVLQAIHAILETGGVLARSLHLQSHETVCAQHGTELFSPQGTVDLNSGYCSWPQPEVWGTCRKKRCGGPRADIFNVTCDRSKDPPFAVDWLVKHFGSEAWQ